LPQNDVNAPPSPPIGPAVGSRAWAQGKFEKFELGKLDG
jgi:hypothetical protein